MLYEVNICRTSTASRTIRIEANSAEEAEEKALERAGDEDYAGCAAEYCFDADGVTPVEDDNEPMPSYTYDDLASDIAKLTAEQRRQPARFLEPYDEPACLAVVSLAVASEEVISEGEVLLKEGEVYLQS
jgi:hypothetical protein